MLFDSTAPATKYRVAGLCHNEVGPGIASPQEAQSHEHQPLPSLACRGPGAF